MIERLVLGYNNYKNILVLHPIYTVIYHLLWPVSSVIERRFYTANVGGLIPSRATSFTALPQRSITTYH
jgi:hypothetical protein